MSFYKVSKKLVNVKKIFDYFFIIFSYSLLFFYYFLGVCLASSNLDKLNIEYILSFKYYDYNLKSNIEYFLFNNNQQIVDYTNNKIYIFPIDKNVFNILNELYNLKGKEFPIYYYPPIPKENMNNKKSKNKSVSFGTIAYLKKYYESDLEVMYLYDYATPNFYRYIDLSLASILYPIEDNLKILVNQIMVLRLKPNDQENKVKDYLDYLNYIKAFNNLNKPEVVLYEVFFIDDNFYFKFLDTKLNIIRVFKVNEYKVYKELGSYYFKDVDIFKF
ncbi:MAG: hypothetical protein ACP5O4_03165 [bacterium]